MAERWSCKPAVLGSIPSGGSFLVTCVTREDNFRHLSGIPIRLDRVHIFFTLFQDKLYTYNKDYHHSKTFVPVNVKEQHKKAELSHRQKFVAVKDWIYPGVKNLRMCNEHPKKPHVSRADGLKEVGVLIILFG